MKISSYRVQTYVYELKTVFIKYLTMEYVKMAMNNNYIW